VNIETHRPRRHFARYHIARLGAVARHCDLLAIEQQVASTEYAWDATPHDIKALTNLMLLIAEDSVRRRVMGEASSNLIDVWSPAVFAGNPIGLTEAPTASTARRPALADKVELKLTMARQGIGFR